VSELCGIVYPRVPNGGFKGPEFLDETHPCARPKGHTDDRCECDGACCWWSTSDALVERATQEETARKQIADGMAALRRLGLDAHPECPTCNGTGRKP
jgi:hypothetical protein